MPDHEGVRAGRWTVLAALSAATALIMGGPIVSLGIYIPVLARVEGWSAGMLGGAAMALLLGLSISGIASGALADRWNPGRIIVAGLLMTGLGCLGGAAAHTATYFLIACAGIGIGAGFATNVTSIPVISGLFGERRGMALGFYFAIAAISCSVLPLIQSALIESYGWRTAFGVIGAAVLALALPVATQRMSRAPAAEVERVVKECAVGLTVRETLATPHYWYLVVAMTLTLLSIQGVVYSFASYLQGGGLTQSRAVALFSAANLISAPAQFAIGLLADRFGARQVIPYGLLLQGIATLSLLAGFCPAPIGPIALAMFALGWGLSCGSLPQTAPMLLQDVTGSRHYGVLLGIASAVSGIVSALAPLLSAWIASVQESYRPVVLACGLACFAALPLIQLVRTSPGGKETG